MEKFIAIQPRYQKYAEVLQQVLRQAVKKYDPLAIVQARAKSVASFGEKILRKKYSDPLKQMTDLCGARVIVHTHSEVQAVSQFIESHFEIDKANTIDVTQRLKPAEFGYRSIHYIVSFKPGVFPNPEIDIKIPKNLFNLKAEIQVRTVLEHGWADVYHDMGYKGGFKMPDVLERELAATAALLENADRNFSRIIERLQAYRSSYGAYLSKEQMQEKLEQLEMILKYDPNNLELASRIGQLAIAMEEWQKAIHVLSRYKTSNYAPILKNLGIAMCKQHRKTPDSAQYKQGQKFLETACALANNDVDAIASLAGTWKIIDEEKTRELYRQAFEVDPSDSYALGNYLEYEIAAQKTTAMLPLMKPVIEKAIQRCRDQAEVGVNLPWAFYDIGKFYLLLHRPSDSLAAYAKAVQLSTASFMVKTSLRSLEKLAPVEESLPGYEWARRLLMLGWAARFPASEIVERLKALASPNVQPLQAPVVVVAGGTDASIEQDMQNYRELLLQGFKNYQGTLVSGGTRAGISGLVGDVGETYRDAITTIGYVPKHMPHAVQVEATPQRYREIRATDGGDFSVLEALQYWIDIAVSGIAPASVKLIGINGGGISALEYRITLALGGTVAIIADSGREADQLLKDENWRGSEKLLRLPADAVILQQFLGASKVTLEKQACETIACAIHDEYRRNRSQTLVTQDPAMVDWEKLAEHLRESNRQQAQHIFDKLTAIGCSVREVKDRDIARMTFTKEEIEQMAEMEHARWVVERLLDRWQWGPKRDVTKKFNPYLVGWLRLPEDVKEWDRQTVRKIPEFLAAVGLEVVRQE